tara:strand:- start:790 stop:1068 length:279 start_codon:yes stop_codon:yes gene_type:complete
VGLSFVREIRYIHQGPSNGIGYQVINPHGHIVHETPDKEEAERYLMEYDHEAMNVILRKNVKDLQEQLQESYKKLKELSDQIDKIRHRKNFS